MSIKKMLAVALARYLPVFTALFGVALLFMSMYFGNTTMILLSIIIFSVLPPVLEEVGHSLEERYATMRKEMDMTAMILKIPEWLLDLEMLASIAVIVVSAVLKNIAIMYLGAWLLFLGVSLDMAKEINGLKEDLWGSDLEKRRAAMEKVESYRRFVVVLGAFLFTIGLALWGLLLAASVAGVPGITESEPTMVLLVALLFLISVGVVYYQADKVMPPEPEKAARAAS
ncbi:MAG: hypothetical protein RXP86_11905 [Acidilobus sp.]